MGFCPCSGGLAATSSSVGSWVLRVSTFLCFLPDVRTWQAWCSKLETLRRCLSGGTKSSKNLCRQHADQDQSGQGSLLYDYGRGLSSQHQPTAGWAVMCREYVLKNPYTSARLAGLDTISGLWNLRQNKPFPASGFCQLHADLASLMNQTWTYNAEKGGLSKLVHSS